MISSSQLKIYRSLLHKKYRYKHGRFLFEGANLCEAALASDAELEILLISDDVRDKPSNAKLKDLALAKIVPFEIVPDEVIESLSDAVTPQGIVAVAKMKMPLVEDLWSLLPAEILVLDQIRDPGNLGTILRTAEWFGIQAVVLSKNCVDLFNSKVLRSSAGSYFQLNTIINDVDLMGFISLLSQYKYKIIAADPSASISYTEIAYERPFALIIGSERNGVDKRIHSLPTTEICVPRQGKADSLNAAVTAGILLGEAFRGSQIERG